MVLLFCCEYCVVIGAEAARAKIRLIRLTWAVPGSGLKRRTLHECNYAVAGEDKDASAAAATIEVQTGRMPER